MEDKPVLTDEDLKEISQWLKSKEGKTAFRRAIEESEQKIAELDRSRRLTGADWKEPFTI